MSKQFSIMRKLEIDAAHRVPHHASKCYNIHGHRYIIEATCVGDLIADGEQQGMIMDFGFLKECMIRAIHDPCDHGIIFWTEDPMLDTIRPHHDGWKIWTMVDVPTAENLAALWYTHVQQEINKFFAALGDDAPPTPKLACLTVWETPNCKATYPA